MRTFTKKEMISIFELREVLEGLAARKAAQKITDNQIVQLVNFLAVCRRQDVDDIRAYARGGPALRQLLLDIGPKEFLKSMLETYNVISYSYQAAHPRARSATPGRPSASTRR